MKTPSLRSALFFLALAALVALAGCGKRETAHDHAAHGGHHHAAPHGGTLVEIGEHAYNVELVLDAAAGRLTAYVLDGHAENFKRIAMPALEIVTVVNGQKQTLALSATANPATGETVGNTSQFDGQADWLKGVKSLEGVITKLEIGGSSYSLVGFKL